MTLRVPLASRRYVTLVSAYAPTLTSDDGIKDEFYDLLDRTLRAVPRTDKIVLLGDFNARVGSNHTVWGGIIGRHGVGNVNSNGLRLLNLCADHDLVITNTMFQMSDKFKTSWMHPRSKHWHLIDFVIVRKSDLQDVSITRALRGADCWTDHRLIRSVMHLRMRPPVRKQPRPKRLNRSGLLDPSKRVTLRQNLANVIAQEPTPRAPATPTTASLTEDWARLSSSLLEATVAAVGYSCKRHQDWFDDNSDEIHDLLKRKRSAQDAVVSNPSSVSMRARFAALRSEVQTTTRRLENDWWKGKAKEIQGFADTNDLHSLYDSLKGVYGPVRSSSVPMRSADGTTLIKDRQGILARWAEHLNELLNRVNPADPSVIDRLPTLPLMGELDLQPSFSEVHKAAKSLKNNKAVGPDGLPAEVFKYGGYTLTRRVHRFIRDVWQSQRLPQQWKDANIVTVYKRKGDKAVCGNYRGISLLAVAGKVLARVMLARLLATITDVVLPESQCGFRRDRSTTDMIFVARLLQEKCREQHRNLYMAFVDLTKAFDTVNRDILWRILAKCGCPPRFTSILKDFHSGMSARVAVGGLESEPFEVNVGVKQGCVLAPALFNIYLVAVTLLSRHSVNPDDGVAIRYRLDGSVFNLRRLQAKTKTRQAIIHDLQYADDAAFPSHSSEGLQRVMRTMSDTYTSTGLVINPRKTEVLCQHSSRGEAPPDVSFRVGADDVTCVDRFIYLGSVLSSSCSLDDEIQNRLRQASCAFGRLSRRVFLNRDLTTSTKVAVYSAVCISVLLYGCEAWTVYRAQVRSLEAFHIRCLQRILGLSWADRVPHVQILQSVGCVSIEALIVKRQLRWVGHVCRMPESRLPRKLLFGELASGRRSAGGQKKRYKDHLHSMLKKCGVPPSDMETLAADRNKWRSTCRAAAQTFEAGRSRDREERSRRRHERQDRGPPPPGDGIPCPTCGRRCASEFGLRSHLRSHRRRDHPPIPSIP